MYIHSVKVPRLYKSAAKILQEVKENGSSLKQLLYTNKHCNIKGIYALVVETLRHFSQIDTLIEQSEIFANESRINPWLARILITELIWNEKLLPGESKPIQTIMSYHEVLKKHKANLSYKSEPKMSNKVQKPRFVRINTLVTTLEEVINGFRDEEWQLVPSTGLTYEEYLSQAMSLEMDQFMIDLHLKELLLFPCNTEFYRHYAYRNGLILLQDKASCLPPHLLNAPPGSTVLDMCAAPGMKTTHLAALLNNEGTIYAVERDTKRFETLNKLVENAKATCVKTINKDVLQITAEDCPNVEYILIDPSCSGSGIVNRIEINDEDTSADPVRLKRLTNFQAKILKHALTSFPQAKRVIYSTCSVYPEENENVVREVENFSSFKLISAKHLLNGPWKSKLEKHDDVQDLCLYTKPEEDLTNGFFIAVFERQVCEDVGEVGKVEQLEAGDLKVKKGKKRVHEHVSEDTEMNNSIVLDTNEDAATDTYNAEDHENPQELKKQKKINKKESEENIMCVIANGEGITRGDKEEITDLSLQKKTKKKKKKNRENDANENISTGENIVDVIETHEDSSVHKKHKKKKSKHVDEQTMVEDCEELEKPKKKKKKSKDHSEVERVDLNEENACEESQIRKKSKKQKRTSNIETI